jgi:hypothetical protein
MAMHSSPRMLVALFGIAVGLPLACQRVNPAFNLGSAGETGKADGEVGENGESNSTGDGDPSTGDGDPSTGDGDQSTGDGDPTTGDGDPTTGDGDGDPTTGDGDPTTGDGDGDADTGMVKLDMMVGDGDGDTSTDTDSDTGMIQLDMMMDACSGQGQTCANGEPCCFDLICCMGNPIPMGQEYCSDMCPISDRNLKYGFQSVDSQWVLDQIVELPISTWSYKDGKDGHARHIGPMAQDFHSAFGVGASDRFIFQIDADGVSLAAIQALDAKVDALEAENAQLRATLRELEERLAKLEN